MKPRLRLAPGNKYEKKPFFTPLHYGSELRTFPVTRGNRSKALFNANTKRRLTQSEFIKGDDAITKGKIEIFFLLSLPFSEHNEIDVSSAFETWKSSNGGFSPISSSWLLLLLFLRIRSQWGRKWAIITIMAHDYCLWKKGGVWSWQNACTGIQLHSNW